MNGTSGAGGHYVLGKKSSTQSGLILRCPICRNTTNSIFYNSIFLRSKLSVSTTLHIIYCWAVQKNRGLAFHECKVSPDCITNYQACRQACIHWLHVEGQPRIGGEGLTVQIDLDVSLRRDVSFIGSAKKQESILFLVFSTGSQKLYFL